MANKDSKWFKDLKENKSRMKKAVNRIESARFIFDREMHLTEWLLGICTAILLSLSIADVLRSPIAWIRTAGLWGYIISFGALIISIWIHIWVIYRQKKTMIYLYQLKDKQER